ncbi:hypothetical protein JCM6882_007873 [Rhodosporidiobolus microsporus]
MSSPSTLSSSPLDKLPVELSKHIVELVREQDERTKHLDVSRAKPSKVSSDDDEDSEEEEEEEQASIEDGRFPSAYGRGVRALSVANKKLRELALPHLFETVTARQLDTTFFRFFVLPTTLSRYITTIDLTVSNETRAIAAAPTIPLLPNVTTLILASHTLSSILFPASDPTSHWRDEADRAARSKLKEKAEMRAATKKLLLSQINEFPRLVISPGPANTYVAQLLEHLTGSNLHHLTLPGLVLHATEAIGSRLREALERIQPRVLEFSKVGMLFHDEPFPAPWILGTHLTSIALTVPLTLRIPTLLPCLEQVVGPHLQQLILLVPAPFSLPEEPLLLHLPHLRHLTLRSANAALHKPLLSVFSSSPLVAIDIDVTDVTNCSLTCTEILSLSATLPSTLRRLHFSLPHPSRPADHASYSAARAAQSIVFELNLTPQSTALRFAVDLEDGDELADSEKTAVIDETLDWARRQADTLCLTGDKVGLQHLGEALIRVKELKMLAEV